MQLFQGFLSRGSGQGASHELWPWSLPLQKAGTEVSARAESSSGESPWPVLQHHCRSRRGFGRGSVPSQTFSLSPPPHRLSPPPVLLRRQPPPTSSPRRALRAPPSPWKFPRRPGTAILPQASPPHQQGPSLPAPPKEENNSLSSVNSPQPSAAPRTKQTNARGLVEIRFPPLPQPQNFLPRPVQIRDGPLEHAPLSPALVLWR